MDYDEENAESCKVVLLGESGVGKTSIISQFVNKTFNQEEMSTTGATFASKTLYFEQYNKSICFEIWDTAGQEKFKSLTKVFYKDASIVILVYDITRKESFEQLKEYWIKEVKEQAPKKIVIGIAANKIDLYEKEVIDEETGRTLAKDIGALFASISAKNRDGIEELFFEVGNCYLDPNYLYSDEALEEAERMKQMKVEATKIEENKEEGNNKGKTKIKNKKKCC